jgi:hypothetical protein
VYEAGGRKLSVYQEGGGTYGNHSKLGKGK